MEEFVFAINDQEMEINYIEPPFIIAAEVRKTDWIKSKWWNEFLKWEN